MTLMCQVFFQKVPSRAELNRFMSGITVVEPKPFVPPHPAFQTAHLSQDKDKNEVGSQKITRGKYEGAGAYF